MSREKFGYWERLSTNNCNEGIPMCAIRKLGVRSPMSYSRYVQDREQCCFGVQCDPILALANGTGYQEVS